MLYPIDKDWEPGYTYYPSRGCTGSNELFAGFVDNRGVCRSKCDDNNQCLSFEWWGDSNPHGFGPRYCQTSSSCTEGLATNGSNHLYVKGI